MAFFISFHMVEDASEMERIGFRSMAYRRRLPQVRHRDRYDPRAYLLRCSERMDIDRFIVEKALLEYFLGFAHRTYDIGRFLGRQRIGGKQAPVVVSRNIEYHFGGARVLLAEDNAMNMEVTKKILGSVHLTVDSVLNGRAAVSKFENAPPGTYKAILMDVQMPEMDGYEATQTIRASSHPEAGTIPIIAMTADAFAENVAQALAAGMNDHVSKPIDMPKLFGILNQYIPNTL